MTSILNPPNHDLFCDCEICDEYWTKLEKTSNDEYESNEFDTEHEHDLDKTFERDGW